MKFITGPNLQEYLDFNSLKDALFNAFSSEYEQPIRHHHSLHIGTTNATLLLMPAWQQDKLGVKIATVHPENSKINLPSVYATYLLLDGLTGQTLAILDGSELTRRRTAAASLLAAQFLAKPDTKNLLILGTGELVPHLFNAYSSFYQLENVFIWGRNSNKANDLALRLSTTSVHVAAVTNLKDIAEEADIISCATLSTQPIFHGDWLRPGVHLDLIGGFKPEMRETDDTAILRSRVYVDTMEGACNEAGDIVQPLSSGVLKLADIHGDLPALCRGLVKGRGHEGEITLFKSVGAAIEDLAAAVLAYQRST